MEKTELMVGRVNAVLYASEETISRTNDKRDHPAGKGSRIRSDQADYGRDMPVAGGMT